MLTIVSIFPRVLPNILPPLQVPFRVFESFIVRPLVAERAETTEGGGDEVVGSGCCH